MLLVSDNCDVQFYWLRKPCRVTAIFKQFPDNMITRVVITYLNKKTVLVAIKVKISDDIQGNKQFYYQSLITQHKI